MERKGYTTISKDIAQLKGNNKIEKILTFSFIKSWRKPNDIYKRIDVQFISDITYLQTEKQLNMNIDKIIPELIRDGVFCKVYKDKQGKKERNIYTFYEETNFFYIDNTFFENTTKENNKVKGFLLLLKCFCINGTNKYLSKNCRKGKYNCNELANLLGLDAKTIKKYIKLAVGLNWLQYIDNGLLITNPFIKPDRIKKDDAMTFLYDTIYNFCISKGCTPPKREESPLMQIYGKYPFTKEEYQAYLDNGFQCNSYLPNVLQERLQNMPKQVNWQYLITALLNNKDAMRKKVCKLIITM